MSNKERTETVEDNIKGILISNSGGTWEHGDKLLGDEVDINCCVKEIMEEWQKNLFGSCEGWISCADRLPDEKTLVIVGWENKSVDTGYYESAKEGRYREDGFVEAKNKWRFVFQPTHWMPLPQAPKI